MSTLTVAQLRAHVETDLIDDAVQRLIDAAEEEIASKVGPAASATEYKEGDSKVIFLMRSAASITSITEEVGEDITTLVAADYRLEGGKMLRRLTTGTNPAEVWQGHVTVTYVPTGETTRRLTATIDLVRLAVQYKALSSESVGDYSASMGAYDAEKARILASLRPWSMA